MALPADVRHGAPRGRRRRVARRHDLPAAERSKPGQDIDAMVCWMTNEPLCPRQKSAVKHTTRMGRAPIKDISTAWT